MVAPNKKLAALHKKLSASAETQWLQRWTGKYGDAESLRAEAAAKYILVTRLQGALKQRVKQDGRFVRCAYCGHRFQSLATERIKPCGGTQYLRLCHSCAMAAKALKA